MSLDLGAVVGRVVLEDVEFQRTYVRVTRQMADLGSTATRSAAGTGALDEGLGAVSASGDKASASLGRTAKVTGDTATAAQKAAMAAARQADAMATVNKTMAENAAASTKVQQAALRNVAAQERLAAAASETGSAEAKQAAETARLASAQASAIGTADRLAAASRTTAAAQRETAVASRGLTGSLAGTVKMAGQLGLLVGGFELVKKAIDVTKEANEFHRSMVQVQTNADVTAAEVNKASDALLKMAGPVAAAPNDLATAWYHAKSVGLDYAKSIDTTRIAAEGARVGHADLEQTMNALTSTVASQIPGVENMSKAMGQLIAVVGSGDMKLSDLNAALGSGILTVVKGYGLSLTDVGAALATFGDNNIRGADAATMLRMAVQAMAVPAVQGRDRLAQLGLSANTLAQDMQKRGLNKAILDLKDHLDAAGISSTQVGATLTEVFGKRAGPGLAVLIGQTDRLESKFKVLRDSGASFGEKWKATTQTASFALASFGHSLESAGISATAKLGPAIASVARLLTGTLRTALSVAHDALAPFMAAWGAVSGILGPVGSALAAIGHVLSPLEPVLHGVGAAALAMFAVFKGAQVIGPLLAQMGTAVSGAAETVALKMMYAQDAVSGLASSFGAAAAESEASAATIAAASEGAADSVVASGDAARIGWASVAGPIGLAAVGLLTVISMFHRSITASKEATDAAKSYADVLSAGGGKADLFDAITKQLADNDVPAKIKTLNDELGHTAVTGKQFVTAIQGGNPALGQLRDRLQEVIEKNTLLTRNNYGNVIGKVMNPAAQKAAALLKDLNTQYDTLSKTAKKDLINTKAFAGAAGAIQKTTTSTQLGTQAAQQYARMAGLVVSKNGIVAESQAKVDAAVNAVSHAYRIATGTGTDFLSQLNTFSQSAGTAADRAAMIGATLKANAGDALDFAGQMNAASVAVTQLGKDVSGKLLNQVVQLKSGTIDYSKSAAAPLISDLQSIQSSAIAAAQATYQHNVRLHGAKQAADMAVSGYKGIESSLEGQLTKLGLTSAQAQNLTEKYLGVPSRVRTLIEQEGANPVVNVLNQIGHQLAYLTGHPWVPTIKANDDASPALDSIIGKLRVIKNGAVTNVVAPGQASRSQFHATGGTVVGPGTGTSDSVLIHASNGEEVINAKQSAKHRALLKAINAGIGGFATGGTVGGLPSNAQAVASLLSSMGATRDGIAGFLGNTKVESGFSTRAYNPGENAHGLQQWELGRLTVLQNIAANMGKSITALPVQLQMIRHELTHGYGDTLRMLQHATSARAAATYVDAHYERSSGDARQARENAAASILGQLGRITASSGRTGGAVGLSAAQLAKIGPTVHMRIPAHLAALPVATATQYARTAAGQVDAGITSALDPGPTTPTGFAKQLAGLAGTATAQQAQADAAGKNYERAAAQAAKYAKQVTNLRIEQHRAVDAQRNEATALANEAEKARQAAAAMPAKTRAEKADKAAAEEHAQSLGNMAKAVSQTATATSRANAEQLASLERLSKAATSAASKAKSAYSNISSAAKEAASAAQDAAKSLVSSLADEVTSLQSSVDDFKGTISSSIMQGADLSTVWGGLSDAVSSAKDQMDQAQQALDDANSAITGNTGSVGDLAAATAQLTAANQALTAAQTAVSTTGATPADYAALTAAQQAQTAAVAAYTAAQQAAQGSAPSADQLKAVADAQAALTTATDAYNAALTQQSAAGALAQFQTILTGAQNFSADLQKITAMGGDQDFVSQIAGLGVTAGDQLAQSLLAAGPQGIAALQTTMASIQDVANQTGTSLSQGFFGAGEDSIMSMVKGIEKQFPSLVKALLPYVTQLQAMFHFTPVVDAAGAITTAAGAGTATASATKSVKISDRTTLGALAAQYGTTIAAIDALNPSLSKAGGAHAFNPGVSVTIPGFASGIENWGGGLAYVHSKELVDFGSNTVRTAAQTNQIFDTTGLERRIDATNARLDNLAGQIVDGQLMVIDQYGQAHARASLTAARGRSPF